MMSMWLMGLIPWLPQKELQKPVLEWKQIIHEDASLGAEYGQPLVFEQKIYAGFSSAPGIFIFEEETGIFLKKLSTEASVQSVPLMVGDILYVADTAGVVYAFDRKTGTKVWSKSTNSPIMSDMIFVDNSVLVSTVDNSIYRLSTTGDLIWRHQYEAKISRAGELSIFGGAAPVFHHDSVYVGFSDGGVEKIGLEKGNVLANVWMGEGRYPDIVSPAGIIGNTIILSGFEGPTIAYDTKLSKELWRLDAGRAADVLFDEQTVYIPQSNGTLLSVDVHTGAILWEWSSELNANLTAPVSHNDTLFVGSVEGTLYQIKKSDGALLWEHKNETLDAGFSAPVVINNNHLIAVSNERILYSFSVSPHTHFEQQKNRTQGEASMLFPTIKSP